MVGQHLSSVVVLTVHESHFLIHIHMHYLVSWCPPKILSSYHGMDIP